ncbi:ZIP family metal transporter [Candidatus Woesearchaeota archaeon]|jgi:zinc and cadmium transporter|nr:ZIP family metal transporter [Candidatus Woesearchaeota archaeon]MBT5396863.1 ZIP family metal transporter [Candidatus Woesearchaeota archaeon]MBT6367617.1 ZIP family metal transporter [Candidatus Woesearchaeota archaeon]MBT7762361.1 ZIP family metal transporter [Candidatus Woesearchaeota archaeon]
MSTLGLILLSTFVISLMSFIGVFTLSFNEKLMRRVVLGLVALSAGALMGGAFLHLIPEAIEMTGNSVKGVLMYVLVGFVFFLFIEKVLHWRHCHKGHCDVHTFAHMSLFGDVVHNFIDGLIIAASFVANMGLGVVTTIAVALHEIPQEIGDFGVLLHGGYKKRKALFLNFVTGLTAIVGGIVGYFLSQSVESTLSFLLPFAAGGFIYIAASDLIPEIRNTDSIRRGLLYFIVFVVGLLMMYFVSG